MLDSANLSPASSPAIFWPEADQEGLHWVKDARRLAPGLDSVLTWAFRAGASRIAFQTGHSVWVGIHGRNYRVTKTPTDEMDFSQIVNHLYGADGMARLQGGTDFDTAYVIQARAAVKQRDQVDALLAIDKAVATVFPTEASPQVALSSRFTPMSAPVVSTPTPAPTAPAAQIIIKALLPGHWELTGWKYHWVSPDTTYRTVQTSPFIPGHYEYRSGAWIWVGGHLVNATS